MKYIINSNLFNVKSELDDTLSILIRKSRQLIYLNKTASLIINNDQEVKDTDDLITKVKDKFNVENMSDLEIKSDLNDLLYQLEALGIVQIINRETIKFNQIRIAGERDYSNISKFIKKNIDNDNTYCSIVNKNYYEPYLIRTRQFNNLEYNILKYDENGNIIANMVLLLPPTASYFTSMNINSIIFDKDIDYENVEIIIDEMFKFIVDNFKMDFNKIRIFYFDERQESIIEILKKIGFKKICVYEKEIEKSIDLVIYDKFIV